MLGGVNSYLASNESYFGLDNTTIKNITSSGITDTTTSTTSGLRGALYLQSDVKVTGSGTASDPYRLSDKGDVIFASATLNGTALETFPKESDPYIPKTVTCTNGSVGQWNTEKQKIELTTVNLPTSCVVDFTEGYTVTLNATNGTVTAPTSKVIGRTGTATFTVTPNDGYKSELESHTCGGTLSGNTYTISNITSNKTCSIAFKKNVTSLATLIQTNAVNENGYRYEGSDPNNYITMEKTDGTKETWRIIGLFPDGVNGENVIRVRRHYAINDYPANSYDNDKSNTAYNIISDENKTMLAYVKVKSKKDYIAAPSFCDNCQNHWPNSTLFNLLKDTFSIANYKNTVNFKIYLGTTGSYYSYTHDDLYKMERSLESKGNAGPKSNGVTSYMGSVGLIYPTDYVYAVLESDCARTTMIYNYDITSACHENNWLYQGSSNFQWLITPYKYNGTYAFSVNSNGGVNEGDGYDVSFSGIYSPVMALKADVVVTGSGTASDPYVMQ